jgi:3-hydroxybutyryl-CoA dehydrogenase
MYSIEEIKTIGVAGAGVMGQGIAALAAQAGYAVVIFDPLVAATDKAKKQIEAYCKKVVEKGNLSEPEAGALLHRIRYSNLVEDLHGELIIEAVPEKIEMKHDLLHKLEAQNSSKTLLATNTSTLPITQIAAVLKHPERCVGMHFFNPATLMKLVEVIAGAATHPDAVQVVMALAKKMNKKAVVVKDSPGFIVNRVARQYYLESLRIVEEGTASLEALDEVMESCGFKMGPFKLMDLIGLDTNHSVSQSLYHAFFQEPRFRPSRLQQQKVGQRLLRLSCTSVIANRLP